MTTTTKVELIELDGIPTLKLTKGKHLIGYLQASGWVGRAPSDEGLLSLDAHVLAELGWDL